jgi:hypothetical protein
VSRDGAVEVHHVLPVEDEPVAADQKKTTVVKLTQPVDF